MFVARKVTESHLKLVKQSIATNSVMSHLLFHNSSIKRRQSASHFRKNS